MKYLLISLAMLFFIRPIQQFTSTGIDRTIKGLVLDSNNDPLIGASVQGKGETKGTVTDFNGHFNITLPDNCKFIVVAYTGYVSQEINIKEKDSITVVMKEGIIMNETVITDLRKSGEEKSMSNTIMQEVQYYSMPVSALAGRVAGASISPKSKYKNGDADFNTEDYDLISENKFHTPKDAPLSTFSIDVDAASYANVRRFLTNGQEPPKDAVRIEELVNYFDYDYPQPKGNDPIAIITEVGDCPWDQTHKLVHIGLQGKTIPTADLPASNLVFLLDVSGSMDEANKLPLVIQSFKILAEQLREKDRVAIVVYAGSSGLVLPSTSGANKANIYEALEQLHAGGSTAGAEGIELAYQTARENFIKGGNNRVILATDGDFNVGVSSDAELIRLIEKERTSGVFLTVLGFGMGNYKDNKMEKLADSGNGNHGYVDNLSEARKVFVHEFGGTLFTIAKDVKIQVEFNPEVVGGYRLIGYENRMLENEDFNDDQKDAGEMGSGHTVTALYEIIPAGVKSDFLKTVDDLKYQKSKKTGSASSADEWLTVKFRYKDPDGNTSKLLENVVPYETKSFDTTSENFRWSAAVASFGMLLRDSEFEGNSSYADVEKWAGGAVGRDEHGYRKEFLELVRGMREIVADKDNDETTERTH
ncbi:MAG: von Willebrand factor type A domain-containing protein [Saprospiraceae bacterium]|uniref:von Willebrand factor type A domain-containing protein n=1 Tax=Candidatus Opimibacter skivensis TaxID=2982028 RepID=A0A9D7SWR7_9BACT|nr:von Willebrand factor type A domain-containing protein [Candidatus Opimibacter skivensis]